MENVIKITQLDEQMKQVSKQIDKLDKKIDKVFEEIKDSYVRKEEFATVKAVVYGMVGAILTAFLTGVIYMVFK